MSIAPATIDPDTAPVSTEGQRARITRRLAETPELGVVLACVVVFLGVFAAKSTFANVSNLQLNADGTIRNLGGFSSITSTANSGRDGIDERVFRLGVRLGF